MATQEEQQAMTALIAAKSLQEARTVVRQYPLLRDPGALRVFDQIMGRAGYVAYDQLSTTRKWLAQIQAGSYGSIVINDYNKNYAQPLPNSMLAIVSLISAVLGFTFVPVIGPIVALITGYIARNETRSIPPKASGDGMATAGIIMGWIQIGLFIVGICFIVAIFVFNLLVASNQ